MLFRSRGAQLDEADPFCLSGQRLVLVQGQHGAVGSEYHSEYESFRKVRITASNPYPGGGNSPLSFEVHDGSGGISHYGGTAAHRITDPDTGIVYRWQLSSVEDVYGNGMTYTYGNLDEVSADGETVHEPYLHEIRYGGNAGQM